MFCITVVLYGDLARDQRMANEARVETRSRSRSPKLAQENAETYQYLGKRLPTN